jgi:hypothetical protein
MARRSSPLAGLLIISAIDLLLCCLTAGIMLFIVFQPSQRSDRSSAMIGSLNDGRDNGVQAGAGSQLAPTMIIVKSAYGDLLKPTSDASGYRSISGHGSALNQATAILISTSASPGKLILEPARANREFSARIALAVNSHLVTQDVRCGTGGQGQVAIDPEADEPIKLSCSEVTQCLFGEELAEAEITYWTKFIAANEQAPSEAYGCYQDNDSSILDTCAVPVDRWAHGYDYHPLKQDPICEERQ